MQLPGQLGLASGRSSEVPIWRLKLGQAGHWSDRLATMSRAGGEIWPVTTRGNPALRVQIVVVRPYETGTTCAHQNWMDAPLAEQDPREASARVVESALALVRAELKLFASYTKGVLKRAGVSLFLAWLSMTLGQVALVLAVLSPILLTVLPWPAVVSAIGIAAILSAILAGAAALAFRSAKNVIEPAASAPVASYENAAGR